MGFPAQVVYVKLKGKKLAKAEEVFKELLTAAIGLLATISRKKIMGEKNLKSNVTGDHTLTYFFLVGKKLSIMNFSSLRVPKGQNPVLFVWLGMSNSCSV